MDLRKIRSTIDVIDSEILRLLSKRIEFAIRTRRLKEEVTDSSREQEILDRVRGQSKWLIAPEFSEKLFSMIMAESRRVQSVTTELVGFVGAHGSLAEYALSQYNNALIPISCADIAEVFHGVESGVLDFGIVPIDNSSEGSVATVLESLIASNLFIAAEIRTPIHYSLMALPDSDYRDIKVAYSTAEILGHCKEFLLRHRLEARPFYDAGSAAHMLTQEKPPAAAVIAHDLCAEIYGLKVLKSSVQDGSENELRYVVLSKKENTSGRKSSLSFSTKHKAGSLLKVLQVFAEHKINLTKLESCVNAADVSLVTFLLDFEGSGENPLIQKALVEIKTHTEDMKFFGSYDSVKCGK